MKNLSQKIILAILVIFGLNLQSASAEEQTFVFKRLVSYMTDGGNHYVFLVGDNYTALVNCGMIRELDEINIFKGNKVGGPIGDILSHLHKSTKNDLAMFCKNSFGAALSPTDEKPITILTENSGSKNQITSILGSP